MSHTPGPWEVKVSTIASIVEYDVVQATHGMTIARCGSDETSLGDAKIIAAALYMLDVLKSFIDLANNIEKYGAMRFDSDWLKVKSVREMALSAIKNAEDSQCER